MKLVDVEAIWCHDCEYKNICEEVSCDLKNMPTVDAVEVVRCQNCKHWHSGTGWCDEHSYFLDADGEPCRPDESPNWKMFDADYFCKDGEQSIELANGPPII